MTTLERADQIALKPGHLSHWVADDNVGEDSPVELKGPQRTRRRSVLGDGWDRLKRMPRFWIASALVLLLLTVAVFPWFFTSKLPLDCILADSRAPFSAEHPWGADFQGCDVLTTVVYGTRSSLTVGILAAVGGTLVGAFIGILAGYFGGKTDMVVACLTDVFFAVPLILGSIVAMQVVSERNVFTLSLVLVIFGWTSAARVARASTIDVVTQPYVDAAKTLNASGFWVITRHVIPNILGPLIVVLTMAVGGMIGAEAALSYLNVGLPPSVASWGKAISDAKGTFKVSPTILLAPAAALTLAVFSFLLLGDAVRDAFDRKSARQ